MCWACGLIKTEEIYKMKTFKFIFILMLVLLGLGVVSATNVTLPSSSSIIGGIVSLNATLNTTSWYNITYQIQSGGLTANTSWANICVNLTVNSSACSFDTSVVEDGTDYSIRAYQDSATANIEQTSSSLRVDNTVPTAPTDLTSASQTSSSFTLSSTVTGSRTTSCTMAWSGSSPLGGSVPSGTHSGNTCSFSITSANEGDYGYTVTASDGTNTTTSSITYFNIELGTGRGSKASSSTGLTKALSVTPENAEKGLEIAQAAVSKEFTGREIAKSAGGVVAGAIVGTFVIPGLGTAIGAVIGGVVGVMI